MDESSTSGAKPWEHAKAGGGAGGSATDPLAANFVCSLGYDRRLYQHDIAGSSAHAQMLQAVGLITNQELEQIESGLAQIATEIDQQADAWPGWRVELEDVHMCIEAALIEKIGDTGGKLHTGRSRNDQVALDLHMWIATAVADICQRITSVQEALVTLAQRDGEIVMPAYTHLQRAQPIVVGGELMAWVAALDRCRRRIDGVRQLAGVNPLGSGAIAGSSLPLDRTKTTKLLGAMTQISTNSIDATANRDAGVDFVYGLAMAAMTLSRWAEQWIIYASTEYGFISLDDKYTTGSSMMPQKQNPDMLELIRGKSGGVYGSLCALLTMLKGLPIGYNRDLQEDKRHIFAAYDSVRDCLDMAAKIVDTTRFNEDRIAQSLQRGYLDATSLAEYLVTKGVAFRKAHQIVGTLVRRCEAEGLGELSKLTPQQINQACGEGAAVCADDVYDWLGPANVVRRYQTAGNAGLSGFTRQLADWKEKSSGKHHDAPE